MATRNRMNHGHPTGWRRYMFSTNHKDIGTLYLIFAIVAGIIGGLLSGAMRLELQEPGIQIFHGSPRWSMASTATQRSMPASTCITCSSPRTALIMIFFMVMPALIGGFGNWFVPIMIGAPDMAFPRMNNISFWLLVAGLRCCCMSMFCRGAVGHDGVGGGLDDLSAALRRRRLSRARRWIWRSSRCTSPAPRSILGAINFITTIFNMRAPGMTLHKMPLFVVVGAGDGLPAAAVAAGAGRRDHHAADRPQLRHRPSSIRPAAAIRSCSSTCSGSSATRKCTS